MLPPLATVGDALSMGITATVPSLLRASVRVRGFLHQQVSRDTSTVVGMGPSVTLPEHPVVSVTSVKDANGVAVDYILSGSQIETYNHEPLTIVYVHGLDVLPDELTELVCSIASRMDAVPAGLAQGVTSETVGSQSVSYGMDAWSAQAGLTTGEKATLRRYWPEIPRSISMGSPA